MYNTVEDILQLRCNTTFAVYVKFVKPVRGWSLYISLSSEVISKNRTIKNTASQRKFIFKKFCLRKKLYCGLLLLLSYGVSLKPYNDKSAFWALVKAFYTAFAVYHYFGTSYKKKSLHFLYR